MINNLPSDWEIKEYSKVFKDITSGKKKIPTNDYLKKGNIPVIDQGQKYISGYTIKNEAENCDEPVIIFGDHTRALKYIDFNYAIGADGVKVLKNIEPNSNSKFLYYLLKNSHIPNTGYNRHFKYVKRLEFSIPPLEQQKKIVKVLDLTSNLIEKQKELLEKYDLFLKSKFIEMFGDPILNPMGWEIVKLGSLMTIRRGASPRPIDKFIGNDVSWIKIGDGSKGNDLYIENTKIKIIKEGISKSVLLKSGSLIFANCGVSLGFCRILKIDGCIHDGWLSFENIDEKLNKIFILKLINHSTQRLRESASGGTQPNLNTTIMKNFNIYLPPLKLQNKFASIVEKIETIKEKENQKLQQLENLHNSMMNKAFKGEIK